MRYLPLLLAAIASPAGAQFSGISANGDGSTVYFSSHLRFRNSTQAFDAKIFRLSGDTLSLFQSQDPGQTIGWTTSNFYDLIAPQVSSDGATVAYTGTRRCGGGSGCLTVQTAQGTIVDAAGKTLLSAIGHVNLSPNGQFAIFFGSNTFAHQAPPVEWISVATGKRIEVPYGIGIGASRRVANDGTVAVIVDGAIRLWQPGGEQSLPGSSAPWGSVYVEPLPLIGADARRLVYQTAKGLVRYDRGTAAEEILTNIAPSSVSISDDARVVAYVNPTDFQIYLSAPSRQLTRESDGVSEVALSGDGRIAFAVTRQGRLLRIDVASGAVKEMLPRTPSITTPSYPSGDSAIFGAVSPGSLLVLRGSGLAASSESAGPPLPRTLAGVRVRIGGVDSAIQSVSPDAVWFQVPWDLPVQDAARVEFLSGDSPLETPPGTVAVRTWAPSFFVTPDPSTGYTVIAAHQDWSGLVTSASPARGGEVVSLYLSGLGPVTPAVPSGEAAPAGNLARVTGPLRCQFWDGGPNGSPIYFAGLAPGMVGIYQLSLQVPMGLRTSPASLICDFAGGTSSAFASIPVVP